MSYKIGQLPKLESVFYSPHNLIFTQNRSNKELQKNHVDLVGHLCKRFVASESLLPGVRIVPRAGLPRQRARAALSPHHAHVCRSPFRARERARPRCFVFTPRVGGRGGARLLVRSRPHAVRVRARRCSLLAPRVAPTTSEALHANCSMKERNLIETAKMQGNVLVSEPLGFCFCFAARIEAPGRNGAFSIAIILSVTPFSAARQSHFKKVFFFFFGTSFMGLLVLLAMSCSCVNTS